MGWTPTNTVGGNIGTKRWTPQKEYQNGKPRIKHQTRDSNKRKSLGMEMSKSVKTKFLPWKSGRGRKRRGKGRLE